MFSVDLNYTCGYNLIMKDDNRENPIILHGEWFWKNYQIFANSDTHKEAREILENRIFKVADTDESYRVINSWSEAGLLLEEKNRETGWRKFNWVDLCWLQILKELRKLGFGLDKLKVLKNSLFGEGDNGDEDITLFEFFLSLAMNKKDIVIVVGSGGQGVIGLESEYQKSQILKPSPTTVVVIGLNKIYADLVNRPDLRKKNQPLFLMNKKEQEVYGAVAFDDEIKEIKIRPKDGKIERIDYKRVKQNPEEVLDYVRKSLKEDGRKEITLKQENGNVVFVERIDKK